MKEKMLIDLKTTDISVSADFVGFYQNSEELYETLLPQVAEEDWANIKSFEDYERFWASLLDYIEWISDEDPDMSFTINFTEEEYFFNITIKELYKKWKKV